MITRETKITLNKLFLSQLNTNMSVFQSQLCLPSKVLTTLNNTVKVTSPYNVHCK